MHWLLSCIRRLYELSSLPDFRGDLCICIIYILYIYVTEAISLLWTTWQERSNNYRTQSGQYSPASCQKTSVFICTVVWHFCCLYNKTGTRDKIVLSVVRIRNKIWIYDCNVSHWATGRQIYSLIGSLLKHSKEQPSIVRKSWDGVLSVNWGR